MREVYREAGFRCLSLDRANNAADALDGDDGFDLTALYLSARSDVDAPTFAVEAFMPLDGRFQGRVVTQDTDEEGIAWKFTFPGRPDDADLALLLSLAGMLPTLEEMRSSSYWLGRLYRLEVDASWLEAFEDCGLARERIERVLSDALETQVELCGAGMALSGRLFEYVSRDSKSCVIDVNPLALYALLGLDAQYLLDELTLVLEAPAPWTPGLLCLVCALAELLPFEDEACDEFSTSRLCEIFTGPGGSDKAVSVETLLQGLFKILDVLPGWQVRSFKEIAEQNDGPGSARTGELVWRVTHENL